MFNERVEPKGSKLKEFIIKREITHLFLDLDGTLIDTPEFYERYMSEYASAIATASNTNPSPEDVRRHMGTTLQSLRPEYRVRPKLMHETARLTSLEFGLNFHSKEMSPNTQKLMTLYENAPEVFEGVPETLQTFHEAGVVEVVLTNSYEKWTNTRLGTLQKFFGKNVYSIPPYKEKNSEGWQYVFDKTGANLSKVIGVGDDWNSDIKSLLETGVPKDNLLRIRTQYKQANIGRIAGIKELDKFSDLIPTLLERS